MYTPSHIANFVLRASKEEKRCINIVKLLKLVFLSYGWVRAVLDIRLFEEPFQAWALGPVVPSLYHEFKRFGHNPITSEAFIMRDGSVVAPYIDDNDEIIAVMEKCWNVYKIFTARALVSKTHEPDSPWALHYKNDKNPDIPDDEIKDYFLTTINGYISYAGRP